MTADQFLIPGERHVALDDARAHARSRLVRFPGVIRKLQSGAPVANGKIRFVERSVAAALQPALERAGFHVIDEEEGTGSELDTLATSRSAFRPAMSACFFFIIIPAVCRGNSYRQRYRQKRWRYRQKQ